MRKITPAQIAEGVRELDALARDEYREDLARVLGDDDPRRRLLRVVRLAALAFKEPFVRPAQVTAPTPTTGAWRTWELVSQSSFYENADTWQYEVLRALVDDPAIKKGIPAEKASPYGVACLAHEELGFVGLLARVNRARLCKVGAVSRRLEDAVARLRASRVSSKTLASPVSAEVATLLVEGGGMFRKFDGRALAAFVALLASMGLSLFCEWAAGGEKTAGLENKM